MNRPPVLASAFHPYAHGQSHYAGVVAPVHAGLAYRQPQPPLPMRAPELTSGYSTHTQLPVQHTGHHHGRPSSVRMSGPAYMPSDEELAHLQKLSSEYEPEATGPLVGERQSSTAITTEYANADPIYRIKTAALPSKYAYFRTCRGDGHCGWRAIAFTYFEALLRLGDVGKFDEEEARLSSMHNLLNLAGFPHDVYIDFAEEVFDLLRKLALSLRTNDGTAADALLQTFNEPNVSMAIFTYFKLLASAWVRQNSEKFEHFVPMGDIKTYCSLNIEAAACEIDYVAIVALSDAIIKPAGIGFEIMYLDRSQGEEANMTSFSQPIDQNGMPLPNPPVIRLLYRPGHYDILYKAEDFPPVQHAQPVPPQTPLHVAVANYNDGFMPVESNVEVMAMIPGMYPTGLGQRWPSVSYEFDTSPAPQPQMTPVQPYAPTPAPPPAPIPSSHQEYMSPVHARHIPHHNPPSHHGIQLEQPPVTLPIHPPPPPPVSIERSPLTIERGGPFRPSIYELEPGFASGQVHALPFQTSIFRNSHYNTAHFLNPDFQPEEWSPDAEYSTGNKGRHKSTSQ